MKPTCEREPANRACYCDSMSEESRAERGLPAGFCGVCERCSAPGHTQHFPGPIPYTGAWCDRCVRIVALTWIFRNPVFLLVLFGCAIALAYHLLK